MGVVEYVECIKNATQSSCSTRDRGVQDMFRNYDLDGDNMLGLDDFLRSQVDSIRKESLYRENSMTKYL